MYLSCSALEPQETFSINLVCSFTSDPSVAFHFIFPSSCIGK